MTGFVPATKPGTADRGFYGVYAPPSSERSLPAKAPWEDAEAMVSPGMAELNKQNCDAWIRNAERLAEDEVAAACKAMKEAATSQEPSMVSESVVLASYVITTVQRLLDVTRNPLWFQLATDWEKQRSHLQEWQVRLGEETHHRASSPQASPRFRNEADALVKTVDAHIESTGIRMNRIFVDSDEPDPGPPSPLPEGPS